jgi:hypothetical protein
MSNVRDILGLKTKTSIDKGCVTLYGLAIYIRKYLKGKKENYGNSNISSCKNIKGASTTQKTIWFN